LLERQVVPQDISRGALSAGVPREQDHASAAKQRNQEGAAAVRSYRTMRYGVATDFLTSSSVHRNLSCAREPLLRTLWRALKTIRQLLQYGHGNQISDQIESATCYVQTAAELTEIGSSDTAVAAFRCVN